MQNLEEVMPTDLEVSRLIERITKEGVEKFIGTCLYLYGKGLGITAIKASADKRRLIVTIKKGYRWGRREVLAFTDNRERIKIPVEVQTA